MSINSATIGVALAAGVAGILSLETQGELGASAWPSRSPRSLPQPISGWPREWARLDKAWGALGVLSVNVSMLVVAGTTTLLVQRQLARHARPAARTVS